MNALLSWIPNLDSDHSLPESTGSRGPVTLLLHGAMGSPRDFRPLARALNAADLPFTAPIYANHGTSEMSEAIERLDDLFPASEPINIVGYSLGGLVGLQLARRRRVDTLIGLGAPWAHVSSRTLSRVLFGRRTRQLRRLEDGSTPDGTSVVSVVSPLDFVVPPRFASLGDVRSVAGVSHWALPTHHRVVDLVARHLSDAAPV